MYTLLYNTQSLQLTKTNKQLSETQRNQQAKNAKLVTNGRSCPQVSFGFSQNKQFKKGSNQTLIQLQWTLDKLYMEKDIIAHICIYKAHPLYTRKDYSILHSHYSHHSNHWPCYCYCCCCSQSTFGVCFYRKSVKQIYKSFRINITLLPPSPHHLETLLGVFWGST